MNKNKNTKDEQTLKETIEYISKPNKNTKEDEQILKETIEYISKSSKLIERVSEITKENTSTYPLLDNLTEEYIQIQHLFDRTPKLIKLLGEININDIITTPPSEQKIDNLKYELEHLIESAQFRLDDTNTYFKKVENEYFINDNKNEFYIDLTRYNNEILSGLKRLKEIYDSGKILVKGVDEINRKKLKNSNQILNGYLNNGIALFIILITLFLYFSTKTTITTTTTTTQQ